MKVIVGLALLAANTNAWVMPKANGLQLSRTSMTSLRPHCTFMCDAEEPAEPEWVGAAAISDRIKDDATIFTAEQIMEVLPHRYPFLLVDKVVEFIPGSKCVGVKKVTINEDFFNGHFPERKYMPGVLQIEAMAQVGGLIGLQEPVTDGTGLFLFAGIDNVKWRRPVVPGDTLVMEMEMKSFKKRFGIAKMSGKSYVDGKVAVEGDFTFAIAKQ